MMNLLEAAAAARHDLGKYVAFQLRWLGPEASDAELLEALRADVLATRKGPSGIESAPEVWARVRLPLAGLDLSAIDAAVDRLSDALPGLARGDLDRVQLDDCAAAARRIADELSTLTRTLRNG